MESHRSRRQPVVVDRNPPADGEPTFRTGEGGRTEHWCSKCPKGGRWGNHNADGHDAWCESFLESKRNGSFVLDELGIGKTRMVHIVNQGRKDNGKVGQRIAGNSIRDIVKFLFGVVPKRKADQPRSCVGWCRRSGVDVDQPAKWPRETCR